MAGTGLSILIEASQAVLPPFAEGRQADWFGYADARHAGELRPVAAGQSNLKVPSMQLLVAVLGHHGQGLAVQRKLNLCHAKHVSSLHRVTQDSLKLVIVIIIRGSSPHLS